MAPKSKSLTKAQIATEIAAKVGMSKSQINQVFEALSSIIAKEVKAARPVQIPGLVKIVLSRRPATSARPGRNPFTGEAITIKAKPARNVVRVRALKGLKDMI